MKKVMNCYYTHKSNTEDIELLCRLNRTIEQVLNTTYQYDIIKYDHYNNRVSLIKSPDWDTSNEPIVGDSVVINLETGESREVKGRKNNPQIYHNKWQFVSDDYPGFDVEAAKQRTEIWNKIPNLNKSRIGNQNYWFELLDTNNIER